MSCSHHCCILNNLHRSLLSKQLGKCEITQWRVPEIAISAIELCKLNLYEQTVTFCNWILQYESVSRNSPEIALSAIWIWSKKLLRKRNDEKKKIELLNLREQFKLWYHVNIGIWLQRLEENESWNREVLEKMQRILISLSDLLFCYFSITHNACVLLLFIASSMLTVYIHIRMHTLQVCALSASITITSPSLGIDFQQFFDNFKHILKKL